MNSEPKRHVTSYSSPSHRVSPFLLLFMERLMWTTWVGFVTFRFDGRAVVVGGSLCEAFLMTFRETLPDLITVSSITSQGARGGTTALGGMRQHSYAIPCWGLPLSSHSTPK